MNGEVKFEISGPPAQIASPKFVMNDAAREIRLTAFMYGIVVGLIVAAGAIAIVAKSHSSTQPDNGTVVPDVPGGPREPLEETSNKEDWEPSFGIRVLGPQTPGKYAYAIGRDSFLPVTHADGASHPSGTIKDGQFMLTEYRPSEGLSLPQDITESWHSPILFSAKLKEPTALQRRDASWWSESRGEYIPWESRDVQPDRYVFDASHGIAVPVLMLGEAENSIASGAPLKLFENRLCLFSTSMKGFVPLRCPINPAALWNEGQSQYVAPSGEVFTAETLYPAASDNPKTQENQ